MPRLPRKAWREEETIRLRARLTAQARWKATEMGYRTSLRDHIGKAIDKIDPVEVAAVLGLSFVIYDLIKSTPELLARVEKKIVLFSGVASIFTLIYERITGEYYNAQLTPEQIAEFQRLRDSPDSKLFIEAFGIAYLLIKQGGAMVSGVGNITALVGSFFGLGAAEI